METFKTGQPAPSTDMYNFAGHTQDNSSCQPDEKDKKVPMVAGENFLACRQCGNAAFWETRL